MKKSLLARLIGALIVMAVLAIGMPPAASAAPSRVPAAAVAAVPAIAPAATNSCGISGTDGKYAASSPLLPVNRWADATANMHSRLDNVMMADTAQLLQRNAIVSGGMSTGNFMWSLGTGASAFAINFCLLDSMGGAADKVGATIGDAVLKSGLLAALVVIAVAVLLFQARRRGGAAWKTIIAKGAIVGLLGIMVAGSMASTGGGKDGNTGEYKPGLMSPGWIVTTLNKTVSSLASAPAAALAMPSTSNGTYDQSNPLWCGNYITSLKSGYQATYGAGADKLSSGVPMIMSSLWEGTGLQTWRTAQFGTATASGGNRLDENTYCHLLDWNNSSGVRVMGSSVAEDQNPAASTVRGTMGRFWDKGYSEAFYNSKAWQPVDNVSRDRSLIGWSTCRIGAGEDPATGTWTIQDTFNIGDTEKKVSPDDCKNWFNQTGDVPGAMNWPSNGDDVAKRTTSLELRDYILTLHGNYNYQGITSVFAYNLSAAAMLGVFGAIAISIIVAKVAMLIMIITAFFLVIMCLLPSAGMDKLSGFVKMLLGMNIFVFGIQMIFALVAVLTTMLQSTGATFLGGNGSLIATVWTGLSPLLAVYLLHMMFTKVMKVPSPFKLSAGLAWGASAAAVGGAAAAGVGSLLDRTAGRHGARAMGAAKRASSRGLNGAMSAASGGRLGKLGASRRGAAAPVGAGAAAGAGKRGALAPGAVPAALAGSKRRGGLSLGGAFGAGAAAGAVGAKAKGREAVDAGESEIVPPTTEQIRAGHADGKLDHLDLVNSNVANSQLAHGQMSAGDRKAMRGAAKDERLAAVSFEKQRRAELGLAPLPTTMGGKAKNAIADSWSSTQQQFREKPLRTSAKVLAGGALLAVSTPALAIVPVAAGAWAAKKGIDAARNNTPGARRQRDDVRTENYRQAMRHQMKQKGPKEVKASKGKSSKVLGEGGQDKTGPAAKPVVASQSEARPDHGPAAPVTEQLPVV
ncbi:hypothetical protein [Arthrobacter sp. UYCo732]|uniref:hypothetical protein n=1 Tax=Arthrobacter sp. UYCo732 TaxID=3156336 RepID=UPI003398243D